MRRPVSYRVVLGTYLVKLIVDGAEYVRELIAKKDPSSAGSETDIQARADLLSELRDMSDAVADMIDTAEGLRAQLRDLRRARADDRSFGPIPRNAADLEQKLVRFEGQLIELNLTGGSQDWLRWPARFYAKVGSLAGSLDGPDFPPTASQAAVHTMYKHQLAGYQLKLSEMLEGTCRPLIDSLQRGASRPCPRQAFLEGPFITHLRNKS
jgi:hypothetical protein